MGNRNNYGVSEMDKALLAKINLEYEKELKKGILRVQKHIIRMCQFLKKDDTRVVFDTAATKSIAPGYERLIAQGQFFYAHSFGLGISKVAKVVNNTVPSYYWGNSMPYSYVPETVFNGPKTAVIRNAGGDIVSPAGIVSERDCLNMLFQSVLNFESGYDTYLRDYPASFFFNPPAFDGDRSGIQHRPTGDYFLFKDNSNSLVFTLPNGSKELIEGVDPNNYINAAVMELEGYILTVKS